VGKTFADFMQDVQGFLRVYLGWEDVFNTP
jgi:hypothetical protein